MSDWLPQLKALFPDATTDTAALAIDGVRPAYAVAPKDEAEAAQLIRFAAAHKIPVVPYGGGTAQGTLAAPPSEFILLSTRRLNALIHHEPGDMVATVQAGMTVAAFQDALRVRGQWLPIDAPPDATIGGIVAANTHGPRALGYGTLRDMLLGMTVINGDGVLRKCGGKVVKNVTGYALDKLYIGSQGTIGLITEITFKLRPLSVDGLFMKAYFDDIWAGIAAMRAISAKNLPLEMLRLHSSCPTSKKESKQMLVIGAAGTRAELTRIAAEIRSSSPECLFEEETFSETCVSVYDRSETMAMLHISRDFLCPIERGARLRFGCISSRLDDALKAINKHLWNCVSLGMTDGVVDLDELTDVEAARITVEFETLGINFAFENVTGVKIQNRWGTPRSERILMQQIKSALDPQGIMNPGRFVV